MPKSCQNGCGRWVQSDTRTALRSRCMRNPLCAITSECSEMTREEISNASGKPAIEVSVLLQYVLSRATKLILELRKLFFDTQDCQLFGRDTQAVRSFLQFRRFVLAAEVPTLSCQQFTPTGPVRSCSYLRCCLNVCVRVAGIVFC